MSEVSGSTPVKKGEPIELSFSGSGWLLYYQLGVACAFQESGYLSAPTTNVVRYLGCSGGSLIALLLAINYPIAKLQRYYLDHVLDHVFTDPIRNVLRTKQYLETVMRFPELSESYAESMEKMKKGRLATVVTTIPEMNSHLETEFESREELIQGVLASCALFPIGGTPFRYKKKNNEKMHGKFIYDGGLVNMLAKSTDYPDKEDPIGRSIKKTISISAFRTYEADIKPSVHVPFWWGLNPPSKRQMRKVFRLGVKNGLEYLVAQSFITESQILDVTLKINQVHKSMKHIEYSYFPVELEDKKLSESLASSSSTSSLSSLDVSSDSDSLSGSSTSSFNNSYPLDQPEKSLNDASTDEETWTGRIWKAGGLGSKWADKSLEVAFHGFKLVLSEIEVRRRKRFPFSTGSFMSLRLWIPDGELPISSEEKARGKQELKKNFAELLQMLRPEEVKRMWEESNVNDRNKFLQEVKDTKTFRTLYPII